MNERTSSATKAERARRPRRTRRPWEERRAEVLDAARRTFIECGFDGATIRVIAERGDVNEAVLYRFFPSKEELFEEAVVAPLERAVDHLLEVSMAPPDDADDADVRERSTVFIRDLLVAMEQIAPLLAVLFSAPNDRARAFYTTRFEPALAEVRRATESNLPLWEHREFDPHLVVRAIFGICYFLAIDGTLGTGKPPDPDKTAPELLRLLVDGLATRNGQ